MSRCDHYDDEQYRWHCLRSDFLHFQKIDTAPLLHSPEDCLSLIGQFGMDLVEVLRIEFDSRCNSQLLKLPLKWTLGAARSSRDMRCIRNPNGGDNAAMPSNLVRH